MDYKEYYQREDKMKILTEDEIYDDVLHQMLANPNQERKRQFISLSDHNKVLDEIEDMLDTMTIYGDGDWEHEDIIKFINKSRGIGNGI